MKDLVDLDGTEYSLMVRVAGHDLGNQDSAESPLVELLEGISPLNVSGGKSDLVTYFMSWGRGKGGVGVLFLFVLCQFDFRLAVIFSLRHGDGQLIDWKGIIGGRPKRYGKVHGLVVALVNEKWGHSRSFRQLVLRCQFGHT